MSVPERKPVQQTVIKLAMTIYMRVYHRLEVETPPGFQPKGPSFVLLTHFSVLDALASMVADPFKPPGTFVVKESLFQTPIVGWVLDAWAAIPVTRDGRDLGALRRIVETLRQGRSVGVAAEGTRSRTGRLGPMNRVLVKLTLDLARRGIPIIPCAVLGTYEAFPPGARWPKPSKLRAVSGEPIDLSPWFERRTGEAELVEIGALIQSRLAALLPPERRPLPDTPPLSSVETAEPQTV